jgi:hypothetical protein
MKMTFGPMTNPSGPSGHTAILTGKNLLLTLAYLKARNVGEFIVHTQGYEDHLIRLAAESYRRPRFASVTAIFQFTFVEDWPGSCVLASPDMTANNRTGQTYR